MPREDAAWPRFTLGVETATLTLSVALLDGEECVEERTTHAPRGHASLLLPEIQGILQGVGLGPAGLDLIAVSLGPGSFTGIRIGMSTARALAWACGVEIVGTCSLAALAEGAGVAEGLVASSLDARKREVFGAIHRVDSLGRVVETLCPPTVESPASFAARLDALEGEAVCVGEGFTVYPDIVGRHLRGDSDRDTPLGSVAAGIGRRRAIAGERPGVEALQPVYLRRSDAEIQIGPPTGETLIEKRR
jgi:tRNA threonylcarbamoyladenosine biosynthesis protein TsaB